MRSWLTVFALIGAATLPSTEPSPRRLAPAPLAIAGDLSHISAAGEFPGGGVIVTDQDAPAVRMIAAGTGGVTLVGSAGGGEGQYIQPGGVYRGPGKSLLVLDRAQQRVLVISPAGVVERTYSIAVRGVTGGSSADVDQQRLDARDLAYFEDRQAAMRTQAAGGMPSVFQVVRFDAVRQQKTTVVTDLRVPESKTRSGGPGVTFSQQIVGSPADGWGVTPDGRVAVVRAKPYRVDWISAAGQTTTGPVITYDVLPMTEADRQARIAKQGADASVGAGLAGPGGAANTARPAPEFAPTKPPFAPADVLVSPEAAVWVRRTSPLGATESIYDVFDATGQRVDRIAFPVDHRVVGFGAGAVFVREPGTDGRERLRKYRVK